jgi:hypothetical protein
VHLGNDNGAGLNLSFYLGAGTDFTSGTLQTTWATYADANSAVGQVNIADSTDNEWYITGVQLEAGTTASDFEFLPVDVNLARCQRYFEIALFRQTVGNVYNTTDAYGELRYMTTKRALPTVSFNGTTTFATASVVKSGTLSSSNIGLKSLGWEWNGTGLVAGNAGHLDNGNSKDITYDSEL